MLEILEDVIGINKDGIVCHPFKGLKGDKKGYYSYTFSSDNTTFKPATERELREFIEKNEFSNKGRIRMVPKGATSTGGAGALMVQKYKGISIR
ncbi:hypothetical protein O4H49_02835 [Kiloniella laminariae]|uniref:Uncharacterized protein n=1 Tax=Kiloniella laminariae TaxID=454162 RepID=A0ABT4LF20_9PROT|nr:hypothetical protein [Kiloniella laminariae]MCZ4279698.1 hypothetical protein [Kiloniella laminariae]